MKLLRISDGDRSDQGFTLLEALMVIGILALILAVGGPIALDFYLDYQLSSEIQLLTSVLQQARNLSMINHNESDHGVYIDTTKFTIFQGSSFASRDQSQDKTFPRAQAISVSGPGELIFTALSGQTASSTYTLGDGRKNKNVYVNAEGLVY